MLVAVSLTLLAGLATIASAAPDYVPTGYVDAWPGTIKVTLGGVFGSMPVDVTNDVTAANGGEPLPPISTTIQQDWAADNAGTPAAPQGTICQALQNGFTTFLHDDVGHDMLQWGTCKVAGEGDLAAESPNAHELDLVYTTHDSVKFSVDAGYFADDPWLNPSFDMSVHLVLAFATSVDGSTYHPGPVQLAKAYVTFANASIPGASSAESTLDNYSQSVPTSWIDISAINEKLRQGAADIAPAVNKAEAPAGSPNSSYYSEFWGLQVGIDPSHALNIEYDKAALADPDATCHANPRVAGSPFSVDCAGFKYDPNDFDDAWALYTDQDQFQTPPYGPDYEPAQASSNGLFAGLDDTLPVSWYVCESNIWGTKCGNPRTVAAPPPGPAGPPPEYPNAKPSGPGYNPYQNLGTVCGKYCEQ